LLGAGVWELAISYQLSAISFQLFRGALDKGSGWRVSNQLKEMRVFGLSSHGRK